MEARRDGTAGPVHGDAPEVAQAEGKWPRLWDGGVMEIVAVFFQVFEEGVVIIPSEELEEFRAGCASTVFTTSSCKSGKPSTPERARQALRSIGRSPTERWQQGSQ